MKAKSAHSGAHKHPSDSYIIQIGVAIIVVIGFALLIYTMQHYLV